MPKLFIEYRTEENYNDYFKGNTCFAFTVKDKTTQISIAPNETRGLAEIVYGIEKELQDGYHLEKDEKFEISEFDSLVMEFEENKKSRINYKVYNLCKMGYEAVKQGKTTFDNLIKTLESEVYTNANN